MLEGAFWDILVRVATVPPPTLFLQILHKKRLSWVLRKAFSLNRLPLKYSKEESCSRSREEASPGVRLSPWVILFLLYPL